MIFETTAGEKIEHGPIAIDELQLAQNAVEEEYRARGEPIDPPNYEIPLEIEGTSEFHPHTPETIKDASEEEKAAWDDHVDAVERMQNDIESRTAFIFLEAIKVELPEDDAWVKRQKRLFNRDVPDDPEEKLLFYVNNVKLKTPADKNGIMESIFEFSMSGAPSEVKQAYKDLFRREVEQAGRKAVEFIETFEGSNEKVVLQSVDAKRDGSQRVGDAAESVQKTPAK
jgi:hypothetical protein